MRAREARSSSSWRLRSVISTPEIRCLPSCGSGLHDHSTSRHSPFRPIQADSWSAGVPVATAASKSDLNSGTSCGGTTRSQKRRPTAESSSYPVARANARLTPSGAIVPSASTTASRLGVAAPTTRRKSRCARSSSRCRTRSVMSSPATMRRWRPCPSMMCAMEASITRMSPPFVSQRASTWTGRTGWTRANVERDGVPVLVGDESVPELASPDPLVLHVAEDSLGGVVEADDAAPGRRRA